MFEILKIKDVQLKLGSWAKTARKNQHLSQDQLAETLALSRITIQNLESGKNTTLDTLLKVMQHFDVLEKFDAFLQNEIDNHQYKSMY